MTIKEIRHFAQTKGIDLPKYTKKADLVHLIQNKEGHDNCYATKKCSNNTCLWFKDCQKQIIRRENL